MVIVLYNNSNNFHLNILLYAFVCYFLFHLFVDQNQPVYLKENFSLQNLIQTLKQREREIAITIKKKNKKKKRSDIIRFIIRF